MKQNNDVDLNALVIRNPAPDASAPAAPSGQVAFITVPASAESVTWTQRPKVSTDTFEVQLENLRTRYVREINDLRIERDVYRAKYESVQKTLDEITRIVQLGSQK